MSQHLQPESSRLPRVLYSKVIIVYIEAKHGLSTNKCHFHVREDKELNNSAQLHTNAMVGILMNPVMDVG